MANRLETEPRGRKRADREPELAHYGAQPQKRRSARAFGPAARQRFLDALALTCNAVVAADHAGVAKSTPFYHRARDPVFVEQWRAAVAAGYDRLELLVLEHGGAGVALEPADPYRAEAASAPAPFDFDRAVMLLRMYRATREGRTALRGSKPVAAATAAETDAAINRLLASLERSQARRESIETADANVPAADPDRTP